MSSTAADFHAILNDFYSIRANTQYSPIVCPVQTGSVRKNDSMSEVMLALPIFPARARVVLPLKNLPVAGFRQ